MDLRKRDSGWWISGVPLYFVEGKPHTSYGPYTTKQEATQALRGVRRFYRDNPEFLGDDEDGIQHRSPVGGQRTSGGVS